MKPMITALLLSASFMMSQVAQAHPGHDHSHWMSDPIHMLTMLAVGALISAGFVYKQLTRRRNTIEKKDMNHDA